MGADWGGLRAPDGLFADAFLLRPILESDAALDYDAVMESKAFLRVWEQTGWPADEFTVEENRADLARLERYHADGERFTYTVMNPDETACLGCVYLVPTTVAYLARAEINPAGSAQWSEFDSAINLWVRASAVSGGLDRELLDAIRAWVERDWPIKHPLFVTAEELAQQIAIFEGAGLRLQFRIEDPKTGGRSLAFSR
jgi:hypothetical protein